MSILTLSYRHPLFNDLRQAISDIDWQANVEHLYSGQGSYHEYYKTLDVDLVTIDKRDTRVHGEDDVYVGYDGKKHVFKHGDYRISVRDPANRKFLFVSHLPAEYEFKDMFNVVDNMIKQEAERQGIPMKKQKDGPYIQYSSYPDLLVWSLDLHKRNVRQSGLRISSNPELNTGIIDNSGKLWPFDKYTPGWGNHGNLLNTIEKLDADVDDGYVRVGAYGDMWWFGFEGLVSNDAIQTIEDTLLFYSNRIIKFEIDDYGIFLMDDFLESGQKLQEFIRHGSPHMSSSGIFTSLKFSSIPISISNLIKMYNKYRKGHDYTKEAWLAREQVIDAAKQIVEGTRDFHTKMEDYLQSEEEKYKAQHGVPMPETVWWILRDEFESDYIRDIPYSYGLDVRELENRMAELETARTEFDILVGVDKILNVMHDTGRVMELVVPEDWQHEWNQLLDTLDDIRDWGTKHEQRRTGSNLALTSSKRLINYVKSKIHGRNRNENGVQHMEDTGYRQTSLGLKESYVHTDWSAVAQDTLNTAHSVTNRLPDVEGELELHMNVVYNRYRGSNVATVSVLVTLDDSEYTLTKLQSPSKKGLVDDVRNVRQMFIDALMGLVPDVQVNKKRISPSDLGTVNVRRIADITVRGK